MNVKHEGLNYSNIIENIATYKKKIKLDKFLSDNIFFELSNKLLSTFVKEDSTPKTQFTILSV